MAFEEGAKRTLRKPWLRPHWSLGDGRKTAWKQCWMKLRCDYTGNDMRRHDCAGNGLNVQSLQGWGHIWQSFGSCHSRGRQHQTTSLWGEWNLTSFKSHSCQQPLVREECWLLLWQRRDSIYPAHGSALEAGLSKRTAEVLGSTECVESCGFSTNEAYSLSRWDWVYCNTSDCI